MSQDPHTSPPLVTALSALLGLDALLSLGNLLGTGLQLKIFLGAGGAAQVPQEQQGLLESSDLALEWLQYGGLGLRLVVMLLWCVWLYRAYRRLQRAGVEELRHSPGWAVAWYFIPLANLVKPYQVMMELWRRSHQEWVSGSSGLVQAWWGCWLLSNLVANLASRMYSGAQGPAEMVNASLALLASYGLDLPMALLAALVLRQISALPLQRALPGEIPEAASRFK